MDYDGLKTIQAYHERVWHKQKMREEKDWLHGVSTLSSESDLGFNVPEINQYFQEHVWSTHAGKQHAPIQNLVGDRWLTNYTFFEIINKKYGFVCKPSQFIYSFAGLREKMDRTMKNGTTVTKLIIALNVGHEKGVCYISDEERTGIHWSLLIIDINNHTAYYGDSLAWSLPTNLISAVESSLRVVLSDLEIDIGNCLQNVVLLQHSDVSNHKGCEPFYPLQTYSNMCGVIVVCMSAILCESWDSWVTWNNETEVPLISKPSVKQ